MKTASNISPVEKCWDNIRRARAGGMVQRCHGIPHLGDYSNARHQWGVAILMHYLWPADFPRLALHCLTHDVPEYWVGDLPSPTLRYTPGLRQQIAPFENKLLEWCGLPREDTLSEEDHNKLKACDRLELYIWCLEQLATGNQYVSDCKKELDRYFSEVGLEGPARELLRHIRFDPNPMAEQSGIMKKLNEGELL